MISRAVIFEKADATFSESSFWKITPYSCRHYHSAENAKRMAEQLCARATPLSDAARELNLTRLRFRETVANEKHDIHDLKSPFLIYIISMRTYFFATLVRGDCTAIVLFVCFFFSKLPFYACSCFLLARQMFENNAVLIRLPLYYYKAYYYKNWEIPKFNHSSFLFLDSCHSNERLFLRDFVSCTAGSSGGRLARWLQPDSYVDPSKCEVVYTREEVRYGWPAVVTLITKDQYGDVVHVPSLKVKNLSSRFWIHFFYIYFENLVHPTL